MDANLQNEETEETEESNQEIYPCSKCGVEHDADNLFLRELSELAQIKREKDVNKKAFLTPADLPGFALCEECSDVDREPYTLTESFVSCRAWNDRRRRGQNKPNFRRRAFNRDQSPVVVTDAESEALVSCFNCAAHGAETIIPRIEANAPSWMGCNIKKAYELQATGQLAETDITPATLSRVGYVSSADLLKSGKDGYATCPECMDAVLLDLRKKALDIGFSGHDADKIQPWSLVQMITGVRRKEEERKAH